MQARLTRILLIVLAGGICLLHPRVGVAQASRPAGLTQEQLSDPTFMVARMRIRIDSLNLTGQKQTQADSILNAASDRAAMLKAEIRDLRPAERAQRVYVFLRGVRQKLAAILPNLFQPATRPDGNGDGPFAQYLSRIGAALPELDLTPDQRSELADLRESLRQKAEDIRKRHQNGENVAADVRTMLADMRNRVNEVLTPDQQAKLREILARPQNVQPAGPPPPPLDAPPDANNPFADTQPPAADKPAEASARQAPVPPPSSSSNDDTAPRLSDQFMNVVDFSKLKNRVVVLEFGSVSCPTFRDHVQAMENVYRQYGDRASFYVIYTREAHPSDGWNVTRNEEDQIYVRQPPEVTARRDDAAKTRAYLHVTIPFLVDEIDDRASKLYNGFPNATVILSNGKVVARQQWTDPSGLPRLIDNALHGG